jgi:hypothetical protein
MSKRLCYGVIIELAIFSRRHQYNTETVAREEYTRPRKGKIEEDIDFQEGKRIGYTSAKQKKGERKGGRGKAGNEKKKKRVYGACRRIHHSISLLLFCRS